MCPMVLMVWGVMAYGDKVSGVMDYDVNGDGLLTTPQHFEISCHK